MQPGPTSLHDDLLNGATEIADFLGRPQWNERKVRHAYKNKYLPLFSVGRLIKGRKSELNRALSGEAPHSVVTLARPRK
jgi:hypothetical protein